MSVTYRQALYRRFLGPLLVGAVLMVLPRPVGAAYRVTNLELSSVENGALVTIEADAPVKHSSFTIGEPEPRLVVDFFDAVHALPKFHFKDLGTHLISRIRTSQYRPYPQPSVRVVLDLPKLIPFQIREESNRLIVSLQASSEDVLAAEEPSQMSEEIASGDKGGAQLSADEQNPVETKPAPAPTRVAVQSKVSLDKQGRAPQESPVSPALSGDAKGSEKKVAEPDPAKGTPSATLLVLGIREPVAYSSGGRRDPFAPLPAKQEVEFGQAPLPEVEKLTIVGILMGQEGYRALAQDDDKNGYVLRKGDPVLHGYVVQIEQKRVVFRLNKRGLDRTVILKLPQ